MQERRNCGRKRSLLGARIVFNNRSASLDCVLRNMSERGARIALSDAVTVPNEFELLVPRMGQNFRARLRWRSEAGCGVEFLASAPAAGQEPIDFARRLRRLEAERAVLEARVAQLSSAE
jgi:hypothetical protein